MLKVVFYFILIFSFTEVYPLVIKLKKEVEVSGLYVELGEIGEIKGDNRLKRLKLMRLPEKLLKINVEELSRLLGKIIRSDFIIEGKSVVIKPLHTILLPQEILEEIKTQVYKTYEFLKPDFIQVILVSPLSEIKLPQADIQLKVTIPRTLTDRPKVARIEILVENEVYRRLLLTFNLIIKAKIVKAKRNIRKNEIFSRSMLKIKSDFLYFKNGLPLLAHTYEKFLGKKFVCNVRENKTIFEDYLE